MGASAPTLLPFSWCLLLQGSIAFIPSYHTIGVYASFLLLFCRLLQEVCISGEYNGALTYSLEHCHEKYRDHWGGYIATAALLGGLFGCLASVLFLHASFPSWAWRLPFLLGFLNGLSAILSGGASLRPLFLKKFKELKRYRACLSQAYSRHTH